MVSVRFDYDELTTRWVVLVTGAESELEARQAFSAVVITCQELNPDFLIHTKVKVSDCGMTVIPAV
jgi:hypothetical protein